MATMPGSGGASTNRVHESGFRDTPKGHKTPCRNSFISALCLSGSLFHKFRAHEKPRERTHSRGFSIRSIYVLASANEPVRQLIETRLNLLHRSLRDRRAAANLAQLVVNHAVRFARTNRPRRHILRQFVA